MFFHTAKELGKTVRELLTGETGKPLLNIEQTLWETWELATRRLEQQQRRK